MTAPTFCPECDTRWTEMQTHCFACGELKRPLCDYCDAPTERLKCDGCPADTCESCLTVEAGLDLCPDCRPETRAEHDARLADEDCT